MDFVAIDVETANADMASICQIGLVQYRNGAIEEEFGTYIDPEDWFDLINVDIHGIDEATVEGAPTFREAWGDVYAALDGQVAVCHTHFDRVALKQVCVKYSLRVPDCRWLDSARVARRAWARFAQKSYGLYNVCQTLGYEFKHHDALEDARASGHVLLAASQECDLDIAGWLRRVEQPINPAKSGDGATIRRDGNPEGPLFGEVVVFTGTLIIPRREAADMAAELGIQVGSGVTKKTTLLVVGDQDVTRLAGHDKSAKHRKAEDLIGNGVPIRILRETDFMELRALAT